MMALSNNAPTDSSDPDDTTADGAAAIEKASEGDFDHNDPRHPDAQA